MALVGRAGLAIRQVLGSLLVIESIARGLRLAELLPSLPGHDAVAVLLILAVAPVAALQFTSGWMLVADRPPARVFATWAFLGAATVTTLIVGFNLAPTIVYPWWRWQVTAAHWAYAAVAILLLRRSAQA